MKEPSASIFSFLRTLFVLNAKQSFYFSRGNKVINEKMWNANLMQQVNFIDIFLARHVLGIYAHHQEH